MSGTGEKVTAREAQRLATRERLFTAAVAEFKRSGMDQAEVGAIVNAAGVAHGTFFFHFPTKEHVLAELGQREEVRMAAELDRFLAVPRDLATSLLEFVRMTGRMERRLGTVLFKDLLALYFSPSRSELDLWSNHPVITRVIEEFERAGDAVGLDSDVEPANSATFFLMGLYGLLIVHERNAARNDMLEQLVITVLRGLGIR